MPYIYKITNKVNGKIYIGKTIYSIQKRWEEHINDSIKERCKDRPLYRAFNKYGINNFFIEEIEECDEKILNDRESFWIEFYGSFHKGYNATKGGDGKSYIDYDLVVALYREVQNANEVARRMNICSDSVREILKAKNIKIISSQEVMKAHFSKPIQAFDLEDNFLYLFNSATEAANFLFQNNIASGPIKGIASRVGQVANGKRKTAYKMKWKWVNWLIPS